MELRKNKEKEFHNFLRDGKYGEEAAESLRYTANTKWYAASRQSRLFVNEWLVKYCPDKKVLNYCCGNGRMSLIIANSGAAQVTGIDISEVSIKNARDYLVKENSGKEVDFLVMDAERTAFDNDKFDLIYESGALHHLDISRAYPEIARILKPDGKCICIEALGHNRIIQYYRERTPQLRTEWETKHILRKKDIAMAKNYFNKVEIAGFFHLFTLAAVPFRQSLIFNPVLSLAEAIDSVILKLPVLKWQAWQAVFVLSEPKKDLVKYAETAV